MATILTLGASTSRNSINAKFAQFAGNQLAGHTKRCLDLNDFDMPIYSVDAEEAEGIPTAAQAFVAEIEAADALIVSLAEHNGSYAAAFKSIFDWSTRHKQKVWSEKPMLLLSTSPGGRGGATVLAAAVASFPHLGANVVASFSLPSFYDKFDEASGITDPELAASFQSALQAFKATLS